jgi:energy-converting hydrogenase Eha subunit C
MLWDVLVCILGGAEHIRESVPLEKVGTIATTDVLVTTW